MDNLIFEINKDTSDDINKVVKLLWISIIGPKIRQTFRKKSIKAIFTSGPNLKLLLCWNKTKLLPNSYSEVCELKCTRNSVYFSEIKKKILTRTIEHQQNSFNRNLVGQFSWIHPKTVARGNDYRKRKIREAQQIEMAKYNKKIKILNEMMAT